MAPVTSFARFGEAVAVGGGWLAVGAPASDVGAATSQSLSVLRVDPDGRHPKIDATVRELIEGASTDELLFLSGSNKNWVDDVIYEPWMVTRLLEAYSAASQAIEQFGLTPPAQAVDQPEALNLTELCDRQ